MTKLCLRAAIVFALAASIAPLKAEFIGELALAPVGCETTGKCNIKQPFKYRDPNGLEWLTTPPDTTDGASIPFWAQPLVGPPFAKEFVKAAVIHDHYCVRQVRSWRDTHRVFYDALAESGVDIGKAKLMYYAVYLASPKWVELMPPRACPGTSGKVCIFKVEPGASFSTRLARPANYDEPGLAAELQEVERLINASGGTIDLATLEARARERKKDDFYYRNGDKVEILTTSPAQ